MRHINAVTKNLDGYKTAVEALNSLQTNAQVLERLRSNKTLGQEHNIEETNKYLLRSGVTVEELEKSLSVIHVSGTKGKGSTCAICESILHSHGYKTGFFSSPHLVAVRERIRINKTPLSENLFSHYFWAVYNKLDSQKEHENDMPAYFKFLTIMAFNVFLAEKVDVAIVEVGIGGEYDCTNIFRNTPVVGISSLGFDHTKLLGNTIEQIARQKGGIMKPGALAFTSPQPHSALQVLHQCALQRRCSLWEVPTQSGYDLEGHQVALGLRGKVQAINASLALQLAHAWINKGHSHRLVERRPGLLGAVNPVEIDEPTAEGLRNCRWPGRYQILTRKLAHGTCVYFLDGAHTKESIQLCAQWFIEKNNLVLRNNIHRTLIYNVTGDRDAIELMGPLISCKFDSVLFCPNILDSSSKALDLNNRMVSSSQQLSRCEENKKHWLCLEEERDVVSAEVKLFPSVKETLEHIERRNEDQLILVTGSLHLVGNVLSVLDPNLSSFAPNSKNFL